MLVLTTVLSCLCAGPVPPPHPDKGRSHHAGAVHDSVGIPPAATKTGCGEFDVHSNGIQGVTITPIAGAACGAVQVAVSGTAVFDSARRIVRLPMALRNAEMLPIAYASGDLRAARQPRDRRRNTGDRCDAVRGDRQHRGRFAANGAARCALDVRSLARCTACATDGGVGRRDGRGAGRHVGSANDRCDGAASGHDVPDHVVRRRDEHLHRSGRGSRPGPARRGRGLARAGEHS